MKRWVDMKTRDDVVDTIERSAQRSPLSTAASLIGRAGLTRNRFHDWKKRRSQPNAHNAPVPKDGWLEPWEKQAILAFHADHPGEGYRRLAYMMLDADIVAVSPSSVYRILKNAGLLQRWARSTKKGKGFVQPLNPHEHWHSDISYLRIAGTLYFFFGLIDGASRAIVHHEIRESMKEADLEIVIERAKALFPTARPRIISDNGSQYVSHEFREFIAQSGMTHVRTSPYYPQSNGKIERFHGTLKRECVRPKTPVGLQDARATVTRYIEHYNTVRLHSAIGYLAPVAVLEGRAQAIRQERAEKLEAARRRRTGSGAIALGLTTPGAQAMVMTAGETETGSAGERPNQGITGSDFDAKSRAKGGSADLPFAPADFAEMLAHASENSSRM